MTGLVRKATLLSVCGLLIASAAVAGVPSGATSTVPTGMILGPFGSVAGPGARVESGGLPDVIFEFSVTVRDLASNTVANMITKVDFSACHQLYLAADQPQPGTTVDCLGHIASRLTDAIGVASFRLVGGSNVTPTLTPQDDPTIGCAVVKADNSNIVLGRVRVATPDLDNSSSGGGISGADGTIFQDILDYCISPGGPFYIERADLSHDGVVDGLDLNATLDMGDYMLSPAHAANNGLTCADAPHTCCSLLP